MTSAAFVQTDTEPETTGTQPAMLPPRIQQVADILAQVRSQRVREAS